MTTLFDLDAGITTVSELTALIKSTLERGFDDVVVRGEISGLSRPRSGHVYLNLKDEGASLRAVLWRGTAQKVVFDLHDGLAVGIDGEHGLAGRAGSVRYQQVVQVEHRANIGLRGATKGMECVNTGWNRGRARVLRRG